MGYEKHKSCTFLGHRDTELTEQVFYFDANYKPETKKYSKNDVAFHQPKSGTLLAYKYAVRRKKHIINVCKK